MSEFWRTAAHVMAELEIHQQRSRERDAIGWVVAVVDEEDGSLVHVLGLFPTPEAALIEAAHGRREDERHQEGDEPLWKHVVLPMFRGST